VPTPPDALRSKIADRLSIELGDARLGAAVAEQLDSRALGVFNRRPALVDSEMLSFAPPVELAPEALVVFSFGNQFDDAGELLPGPVNLEMATLADRWVESTGVPVIAQWEVADEMAASAVRVGVVESDDGSVEYLSTAGVAGQVYTVLGKPTARRVAVLAMADHAVRCCRALEHFGFTAGVPEGVELPSVYDAASGQPWTRDRAAYVAIDILARCLA